ncbi:MAG: hypothetical protein IAF38_20180, partial [Bacteroidia bacterium]|nr:hypothetical protein [Bacteroidia bacterium]
METKTYSIFGAGAAGLYTAWRLLNGETKNPKEKTKQLGKGDKLELFDWGEYDFINKKSRAAGARVCTWHYQNDPTKSYLELGGMRYAYWDTSKKDHNNGLAPGHRLVTTVINELGLDKVSVPFNETANQLYYLRSINMYLNNISSQDPAPYNADHYAEADSPYNGFTTIENLAVTPTAALKMSRRDWCKFYQKGTIKVDTGDASVFNKGDVLRDIGYWNLMFDQLGSEGFNYTADGNGYTSNIINWNSAVALQANNEFTPGNQYKTLTTGYSSMFNGLFDSIVKLAKHKGVNFEYHPNTRLHSILQIKKVIHYNTATRKNPNKKSGKGITDAAWLAMPRYALDLVAQATRYQEHEGLDVLNHPKVQLYLESSIMQPSYKVGMFFDEAWWLSSATLPPNYPAQLESYELTTKILAALGALPENKGGFPKRYADLLLKDLADNPTPILNNPYVAKADIIHAIEQLVQERLTIKQEQQLTSLSANNTIGPSVTDMPVRQVVYFGNNALDKKTKAVYGLLASY